MVNIPEIIALDTGDGAVTVTATVTAIQRRTEPGIFGTMVGLDAHLSITFAASEKAQSHRTLSYGLSRLRGETQWIIDAAFGPNSFPRFVHGFGARYLKLTTVAPEIAVLLDREASRLGLARAIGPDIPLVLADDNPHPDTT